MPRLSKRLETILGMLETCGGLFDVGCDHGYTAIEAVHRGSARRAIAADVAKGPLSAAAAHIRAAGLSEQIETHLSDGLRGLAPLPPFFAQGRTADGEAAEEKSERKSAGKSAAKRAEKRVGEDGLALILSGIGGSLMCDILRGLPTNGAKDRPESTKEANVRALLSGMQQLLLSPQSEPALVRHLLTDELGFLIAQEKMVYDEGKYYVILDVRPTRPAERYTDEAFYTYGAALIAQPDETFLQYLDDQERKLTVALEKARAAAGIPDGELPLECRKEEKKLSADAEEAVRGGESVSNGGKQTSRAGLQAAQLGQKLEQLRFVREKASMKKEEGRRFSDAK